VKTVLSPALQDAIVRLEATLGRVERKIVEANARAAAMNDELGAALARLEMMRKGIAE